jgi:hypothetical protein
LKLPDKNDIQSGIKQAEVLSGRMYESETGTFEVGVVAIDSHIFVCHVSTVSAYVAVHLTG